MAYQQTAPPPPPPPEMASLSLQSRIPAFWREDTRLWFAQFESVIIAHKLGDKQKYDLVLGVLQREDVRQVSDIVINPPENGKYEALKNRLLSVYEETETQQFHKLLSGLELGDQKPTQLLRRMRDLAARKVPDDALKILWMGHLPASARAVLSVSKEPSLDDLAIMADKMLEHMEQRNIATIATSTTSGNSERNAISANIGLENEIAMLKQQIAQLHIDRRASMHNERYRARSSSRNRKYRMTRTPASPDWLCYYHYKFKNGANKCVEPCNWKKPQKNEK